MMEMRKITTLLPETQNKLQGFTSVAEDSPAGMLYWFNYAHSTEILVTIYWSTEPNILEDMNLQQH
jgi:hypothetical protein